MCCHVGDGSGLAGRVGGMSRCSAQLSRRAHGMAASCPSLEEVRYWHDDGPDSVDTLSQKQPLWFTNAATAADLEALPRVGPVLAERIVAFRDGQGGFTSVEELDAVGPW